MSKVIRRTSPTNHRRTGPRVRCLGPGPEHTFQSDGTAGNRMCPACRAKVRTVHAPIENRTARIAPCL